jgi:hypothetical protein
LHTEKKENELEQGQCKKHQKAARQGKGKGLGKQKEKEITIK